MDIKTQIPQNDPDIAEVSFPSPADGIAVAMYVRHPDPNLTPRIDRIEVTLQKSIFFYTVAVSAEPGTILDLSIELVGLVFVYSQQMYEGALESNPKLLVPDLLQLPLGFAEVNES